MEPQIDFLNVHQNDTLDDHELMVHQLERALKWLEHFGGGIAHFCGHGDHYIEKLCTIPNLYGINMT